MARSSTPQACGSPFRHPRRRRACLVFYSDRVKSWALPGIGSPLNFLPQIAEVLRVHGQMKHFLDHRKEIR